MYIYRLLAVSFKDRWPTTKGELFDHGFDYISTAQPHYVISLITPKSNDIRRTKANNSLLSPILNQRLLKNGSCSN